jgi:hypothetical protein
MKTSFGPRTLNYSPRQDGSVVFRAAPEPGEVAVGAEAARGGVARRMVGVKARSTATGRVPRIPTDNVRYQVGDAGQRRYRSTEAGEGAAGLVAELEPFNSAHGLTTGGR